MDRGDRERIAHIKVYCEDIAAAIKRFGDSFDTFQQDRDFLNSVSMSIMQIGELSVGLSDSFKSATKEKMQWDLIRGMRNMFAHTYAKMEKATIWDTALNDIPGLLQFCNDKIENI